MNSPLESCPPVAARLIPVYQQKQPLAIVCGFDRITVAFDRSALSGPVDRVTAACGGGVQFTSQYMDFNPMFQGQIELLQPTQTAIDLLVQDCLGHTVTALLTYAEVDCDFIFNRRSEARAFQCWLAERVVMRHQRALVYRDEGTYYFSRRTNQAGTKRGRVGVFYADNPSKLNSKFAGRPCVHVEIRLAGSGALSGVGLGSVSDLLTFDQGQFWESAVTFYELPKSAKFGQLIGGPNGHEVSKSAMRKRAAKFIQECSVEDNFFMHNAVRLKKELAKKLDQIPVTSIMNFSQATLC